MDIEILNQKIEFNESDLDTKFSYFSKFFKEKILISLDLNVLKRFEFVDENNIYNKESYLLMDNNGITKLKINYCNKKENKIIESKEYLGLSIIEIYNLLFNIYKDKYEHIVYDRMYKDVFEDLPRIPYLLSLAYSILYKSWDSDKYFVINYYEDLIIFDFDIDVNSKFNVNKKYDEEYINDEININLPLIQNLFVQLGFIRYISTDIKEIDKIYNDYKEKHDDYKYKPQFYITPIHGNIKLPSYYYKPSYGYDEIQVMDYLRSTNGLGATCKEIGWYIHYDYRKVMRIIKKLVKEGYVIKGDSDIATKYYI